MTFQTTSAPLSCSDVQDCIEAFTTLDLSTVSVTLGEICGDITFCPGGVTIDRTNSTSTGTQNFDENYIANYDNSTINYNNGTDVNFDNSNLNILNNSVVTIEDSIRNSSNNTYNYDGDTFNITNSFYNSSNTIYTYDGDTINYINNTNVTYDSTTIVNFE